MAILRGRRQQSRMTESSAWQRRSPSISSSSTYTQYQQCQISCMNSACMQELFITGNSNCEQYLLRMDQPLIIIKTEESCQWRRNNHRLPYNHKLLSQYTTSYVRFISKPPHVQLCAQIVTYLASWSHLVYVRGGKGHTGINSLL